MALSTVMQPPPQMPQMPQMAPRASSGGGHAVADPRPALVEDDASHGGDACLCVEFAGSRVCAAAWDAKKREVVALPVSGEEKGTCEAALTVEKEEKLQAWLEKPPKAKAAEVHTAAVKIAGGGTIVAPGRALGLCKAHDEWFEKEMEDAYDEVDFEDETLRKIHNSCYFTPGSRVATTVGSVTLTPEDCVSLFLARPRQRATQLVAKPVRRLSVVAPADATQAWRGAALEACAKVDTRCARMVSAPMALALAHREVVEGRVLSVDVDGQHVDAVVVIVSKQSALCEDVLSCDAPDVKARVAELVKAVDPDALVIRGLDDVPAAKRVIQCSAMDAVVAAATLRASELGLPGAPPRLGLVELAPRPVAIRKFNKDGTLDSKDDILFERHAPVLSSCRRVYERAKSASLFALLDDGQAAAVGLDDPFETVDDDGEVVMAKAATVEFKLDARGRVAAQVIHADAPKSKAREAKEASQRKCRRIAAAVMALFFLTPIFYTLIHMRQRSVKRKYTIAALTDFYERAEKLDKIDDVANIADKYEGFEELLFKRLERQYPGLEVNRDMAKQGEL